MKTGKKIITRNKKAYHDYHILNTYEAGIVLQGSEIKSIRANRINLLDGYVQEINGELWLMGVHISLYEQANIFGHQDPLRPRKLLLHKREIAKIIDQIQQKGSTAVPTMVYMVRGRAKVEIALAKGKKLYDKRQSIAKRDSQREIARTLKRGYE
jgi:SsrA-binding protein